MAGLVTGIDLLVDGPRAGPPEGRGRATRQGARPGNYIDLTDDGKAMGIVPLDKLPVTREAYDTQLSAGGVDAGPTLHRGAEQFEVEALRSRHSSSWGTVVG